MTKPLEYTIEKMGNGMHFMMLDKKTIAAVTKNGNRRAICKLNGALEFHCGLMPKKEGGYFIVIGSAICKKLKLKTGSKVTAVFVVDKTEYQFEMPEELREVLQTDPEADTIFHSLTPGNQRGLIYLVTLLKSPDKRVERALMIAEKIKGGITVPRLVMKK
jgi:hypothetical protein